MSAICYEDVADRIQNTIRRFNVCVCNAHDALYGAAEPDVGFESSPIVDDEDIQNNIPEDSPNENLDEPIVFNPKYNYDSFNSKAIEREPDSFSPKLTMSQSDIYASSLSAINHFFVKWDTYPSDKFMDLVTQDIVASRLTSEYVKQQFMDATLIIADHMVNKRPPKLKIVKSRHSENDNAFE